MSLGQKVCQTAVKVQNIVKVSSIEAFFKKKKEVNMQLQFQNLRCKQKNESVVSKQVPAKNNGRVPIKTNNGKAYIENSLRAYVVSTRLISSYEDRRCNLMHQWITMQKQSDGELSSSSCFHTEGKFKRLEYIHILPNSSEYPELTRKNIALCYGYY